MLLRQTSGEHASHVHARSVVLFGLVVWMAGQDGVFSDSRTGASKQPLGPTNDFRRLKRSRQGNYSSRQRPQKGLYTICFWDVLWALKDHSLAWYLRILAWIYLENSEKIWNLYIQLPLTDPSSDETKYLLWSSFPA